MDQHGISPCFIQFLSPRLPSTTTSMCNKLVTPEILSGICKEREKDRTIEREKEIETETNREWKADRQKVAGMFISHCLASFGTQPLNFILWLLWHFRLSPMLTVDMVIYEVLYPPLAVHELAPLCCPALNAESLPLRMFIKCTMKGHVHPGFLATSVPKTSFNWFFPMTMAISKSILHFVFI